MASGLKEMLRRLIKTGAVVDSENDGSYPNLIVTFAGKLKSRALNWTPYGLWSRPPKGVLALLFNADGRESNKFAIANVTKDRPLKGVMKEGEVAIGTEKAFVYFKDDGSIALIINTVEVFSVDVDGNVTGVGNFGIGGNLDVEGTTESGEFTLNGGAVPYSTHVHTDPQGGVTGPPQ